MTTRRVRVARKTLEAQDICSFELVAADGGALPPFTAGAHIDVRLEGGLVRQYSLCNDSRETQRYQIAVLREPASRGGSRAMHALEPGKELDISAPRNHFALAPGANRHLLLAGGIGITPILCMAEHLGGEGAAFDLHYCTRSADRTAFVQRIHASAFAQRVQLHHDEGPAAQRIDIARVVANPQAGTHLYVCGPAGFMEAVLLAARAAGWPDAAMHREYFAGGATKCDADDAFEVQIASSGAVIRVASDQAVVAALAAAGVQVPVSCEQGVCGTCLTRVIGGTPDHRDMFLTEEERARGDQFTPCCSRSKSPRLVLDL
ncbi:PDR/VanB family oxidoreductase [Variovorax sp. LjRoot130]|uniref:PDR/VanB family oxidoreductase n=1 Tax=Variovorax sp. LjRoot130 TaxID=3342261 RepID=UPI003ECE85BC